MEKLTINQFLNQPIPIHRELMILFSKSSKLIVFDIGACTGEDSIRYGKIFPNSIVHAFEPLSSNILTFKKHLKEFPNSNVFVHNVAFSDFDGEAEFYVSGGDPFLGKTSEFTTLFPKQWNKSSSLLAPTDTLKKAYPWLTFGEKTRVKVVKPETFIKDKNINRIHLIHLDVQGAELLVLKGFSHFLRNVDFIWLEVSSTTFYKNQPLNSDVGNFLKTSKFRKIKCLVDKAGNGDELWLNERRTFEFKAKKIAGEILKKRIS